MAIEIGWQGDVVGIALTRAGMKTVRGLEVGDPLDRITSLYGKPSYRSDIIWDYNDPTSENHVIRIRVAKGRVESIWFGWTEG